MRIWRLALRPTSLQLTPWHADTLFGTLCWKLVHRRGAAELKEFLAPFLDRDPPFLISDGIPSGYLPLPLHLRISQRETARDLDAYQREKRLKKVRYLPEEEFAKACRGQRVEITTEAGAATRSISQLHASLNRVTGTTSKFGEDQTASLFQVDGWVPGTKTGSMTVFIADRKGNGMGQLFDLFRDMELSGLGKKKSSGMGAFRIEGDPVEWPPPLAPSDANGFVSLSSFVPAQGDPQQGFWQLRVKHPKLGESFATGGAPFKTPFIQLEPGSSFDTEGPPGEVYGRMLTGISDRFPEVVQYGYAFPVPVRFPSQTVGAAT